jgi:hypothetical protein
MDEEYLSQQHRIFQRLGRANGPIILSLLLVLVTIGGVRAQDLEVEPNNNQASANQIGLYATLRGRLFESGDRDFFRVNPTTNGVLSVTIRTDNDNRNYASSNSFYIISILDGDGNTLDRLTLSTDSTKRIQAQVASGDYYVLVTEGTSRVEEGYQLTVSFDGGIGSLEVEPNNNQASANQIGLYATLRGRILESGDRDFFRVNPTTNGVLSVTIRTDNDNRNYASSNSFYIISILDGEGNTLDRLTLSTDSTKRIQAQVASGDYYVLVTEGRSRQEEGYQLTLSFSGSNDSLEKESNDSQASANPIALDAIFRGRILEDGDRDYFRINPTTNGVLSVTIRTDNDDSNYASSNSFYIISILDGEGNTLDRLTLSTDSTKRIQAPVAPGDYYVLVTEGRSRQEEGYQLTLSFSGSNGSPVLAAIGNKVIEEGQALSFTLSATDPDGDVLTYSVTGNPSGSSLSGATFTWTPTSGQAGSYTPSFTISDGKGGTDSESVTITVTAPAPVNQAPVLTAIGNKAIEEGQTVTFTLSATDSDNDVLTYSVTGNPSGSSLSGNSFTWTPTSGQTGSYTPSFTVRDGRGGSDSESVTITVTAPAPVNQSPVLVDIGGKAIVEGQVFSFTLSATDPDNDILTYSVTSNPAGSSLSGNTFTWAPTAGQAGSYTFAFTVSDGKGGTDSKDATITVTAPTPVNQPPVLAAIGNKAIEEGQTISVALSATDADGDVLTYSVAGNPSGSSLSGNTFTWTPSSGQAGSYTPSFTVSDGRGGSDSESVTITVAVPTPVNRPPVLAAISSKIITTGQLLNFALSATDSDGDVLTYSVTGGPSGSSLSGTTFTWTPTSDQAGSYTPSFTVSDGKGGTDSKNVTITVAAPAPVNQPPVLVVIEAKTIEENQTLSFALSGSDSDGDALTYSVTGNPDGSSLSGTTFTWTPSSGQAGSYSLSFTVSDGRGGTSSQSVTIAVTVPVPVNQAPSLAAIQAKAIEEGQTLSFVLSGSDPDGDSLTYGISGNPAGSSLSGSTFSWVPAIGQAGSYTVSFTVSDGRGGSVVQSAAITVTPAPREPVAQNNPPMIDMGQLFTTLGGNTLKEGVLLSFSVPASDPDGDGLTFIGVGNPPGSTLVDGVFSWIPTYDQAESYTLTFTVSDGKGGTDTESIAINIAQGNRGPALGEIRDVAVREGQEISFVVPGSDPDGDSLTFTVLGNPAGSSLASNVFAWTPGVDQVGSHRLVFSVDDGRGGTDSKAMDITVLQGNQSPVLAAIEERVIPEGQLLSITLLGTDPEGEKLTYSVSGNPSGSVLQGSVFSWTPSSGQAGSHTLNFTVADPHGASHSRSAIITVSPPNHQPLLAEVIDRSIGEGQPVSFILSATDSDNDDLTYAVSGHPTGSMLEGNTFSWTPSEGQAGRYTLTFTVSDGKGGTDRKSGTITVQKANRKPVLADIANQSVQEGQTLEFTLNATDPDDDPLTYSISGNPVGSVLSDGVFTFTPTADQTGSSEVIFTVTDDEGAADTQSVTVTVTPGNHKPVLVDLVPRTIEEDQTLSFTINANDIDEDELTYSVSGNPSGSRLIDNVFSWQPEIGQVGSYSVTFSVSDGEGGADTQTTIITVTEIPKPEPSSLEVTVTPVVPTEDSDIELQIGAVFPSLSATILRHFFAVDEEMVSIFLSTGQLEDTPDDPSLGWNVTEHIGRLEAGNYEIVVIVNGRDFLREDLQVRNSTGSRGIVSMDFDTFSGNQGREEVDGGKIGREYDLQLHIKDIQQAFSGWSITFRFDPEEIEYIPGSFRPSEFILGLTPLEIIEPGVVEIGGTVLGQSEGASGDAELATVSFRLLDGFAEKTSILITDNNLKFPDGGSERYPIFREAVIYEQLPVQGDFDGDGKVDFSDFFAFADAFGGSDSMFDLDGDGRVDFTDFFTFADNFGKEARAKLMRLAHEHIGLPRPSQIEQNYPNPFNASTTIRYSTQRSGSTKLSVLDIAGQVVRNLSAGHHKSGPHNIVWDGRDNDGIRAASGVYIVWLKTETTSDIHKILFIE